jgi:hydroxyacylglutathione hydrolase
MRERAIEQIAPGVLRLPLRRFDALNVYLLGDVLVDAGMRFSSRRLLAALAGVSLTAHALTHAHFDHRGCSDIVCRRFGIPLWCGEGDRTAVETGDASSIMPHRTAALRWVSRRLGGPPFPVARSLHEGDDVAGFTVIETPGHTPGHVAFWRERDGVLILGDVLFHRNPVTLRPGLSEPVRFATLDPAANRAAARKLAALEPAVICFGHGAPLRDAGVFARFVATLPSEAPPLDLDPAADDVARRAHRT